MWLTGWHENVGNDLINSCSASWLVVSYHCMAELFGANICISQLYNIQGIN